MAETLIAHLSDIHFGGRCDLEQVALLEELLPTLTPQAIVVTGDLAQRARHGEFQAAMRFLAGLRRHAPILVVPGNHDVQWWRSPLSLFGQRPKFRKYRQYFGEELTPVLELDEVIIAGMLTAHGLAWGSITWNPNDLTVKGHLPRREVKRVRELFVRAPAHKARLVALHHNVLPGVVSERWGLARPHRAQRALLSLDADAILCGHDHTEGAGQVGGRVAVSTSGTHSVRTRGGRPAAFNLVRVDASRVQVEHYLYGQEARTFRRAATSAYARPRAATQSLG